MRESVAELDVAMSARLVAFPQDGVLRRDGIAQLLRQAAAQGVELVGGLDPASIDRADILLVDAENPMDALAQLPSRRLVMAGGQVLHEH